MVKLELKLPVLIEIKEACMRLVRINDKIQTQYKIISFRNT